jgi:flavin-dependent dehydrogenase
MPKPGMSSKHEIVIIGGGLAGLVCAIHLCKLGYKVVVIEKTTYPQHKVCGEYVSNEVIPYLEWLGCDPVELAPIHINRLSLSSKTGATIECVLPLGGFGVSRYTLDYFLYQKAISMGCEFITDKVLNVIFEGEVFSITTAASGRYICKLTIGAYGKRSGLDQYLQRRFIFKKSPWLAVKAHYKGEHPDDLVGLHNFEGGYCGVSKVEHDRINICYLTDYQNFKKYKNISDFQEKVLHKNPRLKDALGNATLLFDHPLTISQISFDKKDPVCKHILMIGDTAGLIHPLCGNGMAMAIHSAKLCAEACAKFMDGKINRNELEKYYSKAWNKNFKGRLTTGRLLSGLLRNKSLYMPLMSVLINYPSLLPLIIKKTHGKPITI